MKKNLIRFGTAAALAAGLAVAQSSSTQSTNPQDTTTPQSQSNTQQSTSPQSNTSNLPSSGAQSNTPARRGAMVHKNWGPEFRQRMAQQLNLTPAQREHANAIFREEREQSRPIRQELMRNREAMAQAVKTNDAAKIRDLSAERGRLVGRLTTIRSEANARFYSRLNAEQRSKVDQMHRRFEQRRQQMRTNPRTNG